MGAVLFDSPAAECGLTEDALELALDRRLGQRPLPAPNRAARRRLVRLWRAEGFDERLDAELEQRLVPPIAGGATGAGGVAFVSNLPPDRFRMDQRMFETSTERQDIPLAQVAFPGLGSNSQIRVQNVGVLSMLRLYCSLSLTVSGTGAVTALQGFPYALIKRLALNINGQTSIIAATGAGLRARRQRLFRNATDTIENAPAVGTIANGTYTVAFMIDVPVSHDMLTGIGWILAQNPSTGITVDISWANSSDVFTIASGGAVALTGTVYPMMTTFAVGQAAAGNQAVTVVPDLTVFHGLIENDAVIAAAGIVQAPLIRTAGQLVNYFFNLNNGGAAEIAPSALSEIQFRYGGNRQPRVYNPPQQLIEKNQQDYNGLVIVRSLTHTYLDFEVDNPVRDLFIPEALVELLAQVTIPNSVTVNAGAKFHYGEETLYPAV